MPFLWSKISTQNASDSRSEISRSAQTGIPAFAFSVSGWLLCGVLILGILSCSTTESHAAVAPYSDGKVSKIVDRHAGGDLDQIWKGSTELERLGDDSIGEIQGLLGHENTGVRLMGAKALLSLGELDGIRDILLKIVNNADNDSSERSSALYLLGEFNDKKTTEGLRGMVENLKGDALLRIELGRALYKVSKDRSETRALLQPLLTVDDSLARTGAALVLAELCFMDGDVKRVTVPTKTKRWWQQLPDGKYQIVIKYRGKMVELEAGKEAIEVADWNDLVPTFKRIITSIDQGDFDLFI